MFAQATDLYKESVKAIISEFADLSVLELLKEEATEARKAAYRAIVADAIAECKGELAATFEKIENEGLKSISIPVDGLYVKIKEISASGYFSKHLEGLSKEDAHVVEFVFSVIAFNVRRRLDSASDYFYTLGSLERFDEAGDKELLQLLED